MKRFGSTFLLVCMLFAALTLVSCAGKEQAPAPSGQTAETPQTETTPADSADSRPAPAGETTPAPAPAETKQETADAKPTLTRPAQPEPSRAPVRDPNVVMIRFETTKGDIDIEVHKDWAPLGAARFQELVESGYYDGARFFRVVPGFVAQFGIAGNPLLTSKWKNANLRDDAVLQSNKRGTLSFATAGPNTRTTQLFINLADNDRLDGMGFSVFAKVVRGMDAVDSIDSRYGEQPQQPRVEEEGEAYLQANFPYLDKIVRARILN